MLWQSVLTVLLCFNSIECANVLAILPIQGYSHFRVFRPLLEKLAERGHEVDVLSNFPRETPIPRYNDLSVRGSIPILTEVDISSTQSMTILKTLQLGYKLCGTSLCEAVMKTNVAKNLMKSKKQYDLIIIEAFLTECILGYFPIFKAPVVAMSSSVNWPWTSDSIGLPDNPSYIPNSFVPHTENMNFFERLHNAATLYLEKNWYNYFALEESNKFIEETFGKSGIHVRNILKNISLVMTNSHFSVHQSRPMTSNFIEVGGIHINPNQTLLAKYEDYLETDLEGVAFLSFGTYLNTAKFPKYYIITLLEALKDVPYKILWKADKDKFPKDIEIPKNIHFVPWLPQVEILCHPSVKLFITHCGMASFQETIYCGKPILGLPVWVDQFAIANKANLKGIGVIVPFFELTKPKLMQAVKELLENSMYETNAKKLSEVYRDRPMSPLDTAVYWTEYVIRHKGAKHLRPKSADLPWYTYYCVDIIVIPSFIVFILFIFIYKLLKYLKSKISTFISYNSIKYLRKEKMQ